MARSCRRSSAPRVWAPDRTPRWRPRRAVVAIVVTASAETVAVVVASAVVIVAGAATVQVERRVQVGEDRLRLALDGLALGLRARERVHHVRHERRLPRRLPAMRQ